ncbi:MAG: EpsD family peptidyl-prolyl cis-trans isomerase [Gammaproteobacteria bacterium]|nr:EpsD family peptidyl-prolyl cis-trans isomerase [Gammaproteobacteria bacterium]
MIRFDMSLTGKPHSHTLFTRLLCAVLVLGTALGMSACGNKEKKAGQALVRVNGEEITVLQVNDELKRAGIRPEQQEAATKQLLEALIDRQLVLDEAMRNEVDRTAGVVQAIERAKTQIITQAYLKSLEAQLVKPTPAEIDDYFQKHPEYFTQRKQFDVQQLVIATRDFSSELKSVVESAKSLDGIASWLDGHDVRYVRGQMSRSTTDLPEQMVEKLKDMNKGQIFIVNEGENSMINLISNIRISPVSAKTAAPQIEQFLFNKKISEAAKAEITHLRASAKIEYLNAPAPDAPK